MELRPSEVLAQQLWKALEAHATAFGGGSGGKPKLYPVEALWALGAVGGRLLNGCPGDKKEELLRAFVEQFAAHAGFNANLQLTKQN